MRKSRVTRLHISRRRPAVRDAGLQDAPEQGRGHYREAQRRAPERGGLVSAIGCNLNTMVRGKLRSGPAPRDLQ